MAARTRMILTALAFSVGISLPVAAAWYGRSVSGRDSVKATVSLAGKPGKPALVDLAGFGDLKTAIQPWHFRLFVAVENDTPRPQRVGLRMEGCHLFFDWMVRNHSWDPRSRTIAEPLQPGTRLTLYLFTEVPEELRQSAVPCDGRLVATDAADGTELGSTSIRVVRGGGAAIKATQPSPADGSMHVH